MPINTTNDIILDLNIKADVLDNWDITHALRELLANALDEHHLHNIDEEVESQLQKLQLERSEPSLGKLESISSSNILVKWK